MELDLETIIFWALAVVAVVPGLMILFTKDIVRVAFWLLGSLSGVAGLYLTMGADFLGLSQIIVYVGGIMVLILFGIMMTRKDPVLLTPDAGERRSVGTGLMIAGVTFLILWLPLSKVTWEKEAGRPPTEPTTADLGNALLTDYVLPFEVISVLLLMVLAGAAYIARRREEVADA